MKLLDAIEQGIDRAMTALPDAIFRTRLHQEELNQLLVREMEKHSRRQQGRTIVPTHFTVKLSCEDFEQLDLSPDDLNMLLERVLRKAALQKSADYGHGFEVEVEESTAVKRKRPQIVATFAPAPGPRDATLPTRTPRSRFMGSLVPVSGSMGRQKYVIPGGITRIGRANDNHIVLPSTYVSQHHARIEASDGRVRVFDLQSTNGTRVNGQSISQWDLGMDDHVEFGDTAFRFDGGRAR